MRSGMLWMRISTSFYRRTCLMVRELDSVEDAGPAGKARIDHLAREEVNAYFRFRPDARPVEIERRLARGDVGFAAWVGDRIVHAAWVATGRAHVTYLRRDLLLEPDELLMYDSYTLPEFRESGIARARMLHVFREYRALGYRRCLAVLAVENQIGRKAMKSAGYREQGGYRCVLLGPWERCWRVPPGASGVPQLATPGPG